VSEWGLLRAARLLSDGFILQSSGGWRWEKESEECSRFFYEVWSSWQNKKKSNFARTIYLIVEGMYERKRTLCCCGWVVSGKMILVLMI
jgi:hypothetical protein